MASLPAVFVELKANASSFQAAMHSAQAEIKKTADVTASNSDRMAQVGKVAFAGIAAAAVGFGAVAVKAALDGQQAHAQLVQAVTNSGTAFASVGGAVDAMSERFAKLGFENDQVEAALARMVTATGNTKVAMDNMGLAADLARARHISLEEASNALGKVLAGNMKGMTAFGLSTKDASGSVLTTAEAVALLNERFGGAAQANAGTYAGKMQALSAEFKNMEEKVGNMLLPVLADMAGRLADAAGWVDRHRAVAAALAAVIGGPLVVAMSAYVAKQAVAFAEGTIATVMKIATVISSVLLPATEAEAAALTTAAVAESVLTFGLAAVAGAAAIAGIAALNHATANTEVASSADGAGAAVDGLSGSEAGLGASTDAATARLKAQDDLFSKLNDDTSAQQSEVFKLVGDQQNLDRATKALNESTKGQAQNQKEVTRTTKDLGDAQEKLNKATKAHNDLLAGVGQEISKDHVSLTHDLSQAQLNNEEAQKKVNEAVAEYGPNSFEARQANLDLESSYITLQAAQEAMGHEGEDAWKKVDAAQQAVVDAGDGVTTAIGNQKDALDKLKQPSSDVAANTLAWQQAQHTLNDDFKALDTLLGAHPELRDQFVQQVKDAKANLPKGADAAPLNAVLDHINNLDMAKLSALAVAGLSLAGWKSHEDRGIPAGGGGPTLDQILTGGADIFGGGAAEGAVVKARPGGRLMLVGEGGSDEAIVPLDRAGLGAGAGGGVTATIIINGYNGDKSELAIEVRDELLKLGRNMVGVGLG